MPVLATSNVGVVACVENAYGIRNSYCAAKVDSEHEKIDGDLEVNIESTKMTFVTALSG